MRILDLFCGAGGAAMGLHRAMPDAEIVGVDIKPQPRYPFTFVQMDVHTVISNQSRGDFLGEFDFVWASPPCQHYTQMLNHGLTDRNKHPDLIPWIRKCLPYLCSHWVIENVGGAPLIDPVMLCGEMFGLRVMRHRYFECSFPLTAPAHPRHHPDGAIRKQGDGGYYFRVYGHETGKASWGTAMGIDWMRSPELAQAIPPAYSEYIARQWLLTRANAKEQAATAGSP